MTNSTLPLTKIVFQVLEKSIMNVNYHILDVVTQKQYHIITHLCCRLTCQNLDYLLKMF